MYMYNAPKVRRRKVVPPQQQPAHDITEEKPYMNGASASTNDTIFVSVPAYRDQEVITTLEELFKKAKFPQRVIAGVCQQIDEVKDRSFDVRFSNSAIIKRYTNNIRIMTVPCTDAKGPCYARSLIEQQLFDDETFFMGIDSHTAFVLGWDVIAIDELLRCNSEKPMLTVYPADYQRGSTTAGKANSTRTINPRQPVCFLKFNTFHQDMGLPQTERFNFKRQPKQPLPSLFLSAGFVFTLGEMIREVPYFELPYLFLGEELTMACRYWTHGIDLFNPSKHIVYHLNTRDYRPLFWENFYKVSNGKRTNVPDQVRQERKQIEAQSLELVKQILTGNAEGIGSERPLHAFWAYVGLDLNTRTATKQSTLGLTFNASREEVLCKTGM